MSVLFCVQSLESTRGKEGFCCARKPRAKAKNLQRADSKAPEEQVCLKDTLKGGRKLICEKRNPGRCTRLTLAWLARGAGNLCVSAKPKLGFATRTWDIYAVAQRSARCYIFSACAMSPMTDTCVKANRLQFPC